MDFIELEDANGNLDDYEDGEYSRAIKVMGGVFGQDNPASVGELALGFFRFYCKFNFAGNTINVRKGKAIPRPTKAFDESGKDIYKVMSIEEPFDKNNVAKTVGNKATLRRICNEFEIARSRLERGQNILTRK
eukprot:GEZU01014480.1.p1 GENE.GEZU01014480.1~~GEZU01014480.1.p1  ORF type:complete len:133 (+),score=44.14 GEZU01014480.1:361-759(+)